MQSVYLFLYIFHIRTNGDDMKWRCHFRENVVLPGIKQSQYANKQSQCVNLYCKNYYFRSAFGNFRTRRVAPFASKVGAISSPLFQSKYVNLP